MKRMLIFWEIRDSSMSVMPILPKPSQYNSQSVVIGTQPTLPKRMGSNTIFLFQKVCTFLEACILRTTGMHTIELMIHNQNTHHKLTMFT